MLGLLSPVGSIGDSYDYAIAELIHRRGPWRSLKAVKYAPLEWVD